jgi:DNA polymerase III delta prime subunit
MRISTQQQWMIKPQLADALANLEVGDSVRGKIMEVLASSMILKTASGQLFTAALTKSADLQPGQTVELVISQITEEGMFAELKEKGSKPPVTEDTKLQQLLKQLDMKPEGLPLQAAKLLLKYNMPVSKYNVAALVNVQKSVENLAQGDAGKAIALMQSELNIHTTEITKLVKQSTALEPLSQQIAAALGTVDKLPLDSLGRQAYPNEPHNNRQETGAIISQLPDPANTLESSTREVMARVAEQLGLNNTKAAPGVEKLMENIIKVFEAASQAKPEHMAYLKSKDMEITPAAIKAMVDNGLGRNKLSMQLEGMEKLMDVLEQNHVDVKELKQEVKKLFLQPEALQEKEQVTENFKDILQLGAKLEALVKEHRLESKLEPNLLQDTKNNVEFLRSINNNINYIQIPLQVNEQKTTADIYVYSGKKRSKAINPENATILVALELQQLGHLESMITVNRKQVDITFKVEKEDFKKVIGSAAGLLSQSLEARGYSLKPLKLINMSEKFSLVELEELTLGDAGQLHLDIRV